MQIHRAEVYRDEIHELGEGPVAWGDDRLLWVDIEGRAIHQSRFGGDTVTSIRTQQRVGMAVPTSTGTLVWAGEDGLFELDPRGRQRRLQTVEAGKPTRFNDGKVDPAGRLWVGSMGMQGNKFAGSLYRYDRLDAPGMPLLHDISCSNGLAWAPDRRTFYYIDTPRRRVEAWDHDPTSGAISGRRTVVTFHGSMGSPDGMCIDDEGRLWVAHWGGWQVSCWDPATGRQLARVDLPVRNVTSCCFCGPERDHLLITTARIGNSSEQRGEQTHAGKIFVVRVPATGPRATLLQS